MTCDAQAFLLPLVLARPQVGFKSELQSVHIPVLNTPGITLPLSHSTIICLVTCVNYKRAFLKFLFQVGYDIYSEEDLLALDSAPESVAVAVAPPPGFLAQVHFN